MGVCVTTMIDDGPPWEIVETFPSTDATLIARWNEAASTAVTDAQLVRSHVGRALAMYWATQAGVVDRPAAEVRAARIADVDTAIAIARRTGSADLLATGLLGWLFATWGPDHLADRRRHLDELVGIANAVQDHELQLRIIEWQVIDHLDHGELDAVELLVARFAAHDTASAMAVFRRREVLWQGCLAMLAGRVDESVRINQEAISSSADIAGSPFSFQNVAITWAIERFLRCGLDDVVDSIRSILASSPRVAANWETGLVFALSECGQLEEARREFDRLAHDRFAAVPRDLNWLVTMHLLGLVAITLDDRDRGIVLLDVLRPFAQLDATHGSGYASYGPVGRVVGTLAARWGDREEAERCFEHVLSTRRPGPWTALTRYDRARSTHLDRPRRAIDDAAQAARELEALDLTEWAERATTLAVGLSGNDPGVPTAAFDGATWTFRHPSGTAAIRAGVGPRRLVELLRRAGDSVDVLELDPAAEPLLPTASATESTLDRAATSTYRRRVDHLERQAHPSPAEIQELSFLRRELAGARYRASTSAEIERARVRVTQSIRRTVDDIGTRSPALAVHLRSSVSTGRSCSYSPVPFMAWRVVDRS